MWHFGQGVKHFNRLEQAGRLERNTEKGKVVTTGEGRLEATEPDCPGEGSPWRAFQQPQKNKVDSAGQQPGEQDRTVQEWRQKDWLKND